MHLLIFTSCVMEEKSIVAILSVKLHSLKYYLFMYVQCCNNIAYLPTYVDPKQIHNNFLLIQNLFWSIKSSALSKVLHFYTKFSITNNQAYTVTAILLLPESNLV